MLTASYLLALLLFVSLVIAALTIGLGSRGPTEFRPLLLHLLAGSLLVGGLYLLIAAGLRPRPSPWNILWLAAIPIAVAIARPPRMRNLALAVPLFVGGWVSSALIAWAFRIPLD